MGQVLCNETGRNMRNKISITCILLLPLLYMLPGPSLAKETMTERPATIEDMQAIERMQQDLTQFGVPTLQHRDNPHEYLFFAFFDGAGENMHDTRLEPRTNVGELYRQMFPRSMLPRNRFGTHYSPGIDAWATDVKEAYTSLAVHVARWVQEDSDTKVHIVGVSYDQGAVEEMVFHRLVDRHGIVHPEGLEFGRDRRGNITVESPHPPLVPPGQVAQVAVFLAPADIPGEQYDARLPPSVISSMWIMTTDMQRRFCPDTGNEPCIQRDGSVIYLAAPGGPSNIGGGSPKQGLEILVGNLVIDYLNLLRK